MSFLKVLIFNVLIFLALFYLSVFIAFLSGMGAEDNYKYENLFYLSALLVQVSGLLFLFFKGRSTQRFNYLIISLILVAGFFLLIW